MFGLQKKNTHVITECESKRLILPSSFLSESDIQTDLAFRQVSDISPSASSSPSSISSNSSLILKSSLSTLNDRKNCENPFEIDEFFDLKAVRI